MGIIGQGTRKYPYCARGHMALDIHKIKVRTALKPRREPYWGPALGTDLTVGFRKIDEERGTWIARMRNDAPPPRYVYRSLGALTDQSDYEAARAAAQKWRDGRDAGITDDVFTVTQACLEYVEDRADEKGLATAHDAKMRFQRYVYGRPFGLARLDRLRTPTIKRWLKDLGLSPANEARTLTAVKAALNLAVRNRRVHANVRIEWGDVRPRQGGKRRRDLFLDRQQRLALLSRLTGALRDLVEATALTGARAGELTSVKRSQFDKRNGLIEFRGKTGARSVPLSPPATRLFERLAESKLPAAYLFVRDDPGESVGKPWAHSDWDDLIAEAAQLAGLPKGTCLYTLRHSFITEALLGGLPTLEVARLVGTSVQMIEKHYGHLVVSAARKRLATVQML
jgi:integrase